MSRIDSVYRSVFATLVGLTFSAKEITALMVQADPTLNPASLNVADHAPSAKQAQQYALQLFERVGTGYRVLPVNQWVEKPRSTGNSRGVSIEAALASAMARIAASQQTPAPTPATPATPVKTPANGVLPQVAAQQTPKTNGEAKQPSK